MSSIPVRSRASGGPDPVWSLSLKPPFVTTSLSGDQVVAFVPRESVPIVMEGRTLLCSLLPSVCPTLNIWPGLLTTFCKGLLDFGGATGVYFIKAISLNVWNDCIIDR